jgi:Flp pilus assembly protein TadG
MRKMGRFLRNRDGNIAIMFAFTFVLLVLFAGGAVDFARYNAVRADLIESLDASGLAIAQLDAINGPEIRNLSDAEREAYLKQYGRDFFHENFRHESVIEGLSVDFDINNTTITPTAQGELSTLLLHLGADLLGNSGNQFESLSMATNTEITRAATGDTEVALVLDTTNSMNSEGRMTDLKAAANEFVDVLIRDDQSDFYSKVAIVPYGMAVNLGAKAQSARGPVEPGKSITAATRTRPVVVTAAGHGFVNNQIVYIAGVNGMTQLNDKAYRVRNPTANTFQLQDTFGANIDGRSYSAYSSGGTAYCTDTGCEYKFFTSQANTQKVFRVSTCASERTGASAYTDANPAGASLGYVYAGSGNPCTAPEVMPLTSDRDTAHVAINALTAGGSTGGHVGVGWGWYAVSPNFATMFTGDSAPAAYDAEVAKSVVIMTDGEYNSSYCNGVISQSSTSGSGSSGDKINCNAQNGHSFDQSEALCDSMKGEGVIVYTVGFKIVDNQNARDLMANCATSANHAYLAEDGAALKRVFADIAQNIAQLHVSR